ncbi:hypothetical protein PENTCL1PPCAC_21352, partial [Pristionchus entomophagus]
EASQATMGKMTILIAFCLLGTASARFLPRFVLPKSVHERNYAGTCSEDDQAKTKTCLDANFATFGFDTSEGLPPYTEFAFKKGTIVQQYGADSFDFYCDFERTLETCLGALMTSACMNVQSFVVMYGTTEIDALDYAINYPIDVYGCQNIDLTKKYYPCTNLNHDDFQALSNCRIAMEKEHQDGADTCVPLDDFVSCAEDVYVKSCDEGVRSYICNMQEIEMNFVFNDMCAEKMHKC